ncbi:ATP-binding protein [Marinospirillum alkaliphilum]|uniref:histidine kinase n=1 Tax=Marinospirillum alkaliphilum DSM 21637 TaxID=1122209 RepID=A0A1K1V754_9GAMM|nr:ATP-binding protein [Marinospirillum alkaliphilum]SFX20571.1 Signal transduction histidine kinase [Marinospirillum alkaliphilum DSM 21637]
MRLLLPKGLAGQLILAVLLALLAGQLISFWILADERRERLDEANLRLVTHRLVTTWELVNELPESNRQQLLRAMSSPGQHYRLSAQPLLQPGSEGQLTGRFQRRLLDAFPDPAPPAVFRLLPSSRPECKELEQTRPDREDRRRLWQQCQPRLEASLQLRDGQWLNLQVVTPDANPPWAGRIWLSLLVTGLLVALAVTLLVRQLVRPLRALTAAAVSFGEGRPSPLQPSGPDDLQQVIHAFNRMQQQVGKQLEERARVLAALSHDLRTPLTHMRLRVELLPDSEDRQRLLDSLQEMQSLAETTLDFVRGSKGEVARDFDLAALVQSLCDDYEDQGQPVHYSGLSRCVFHGRSQALRRALQNLIDNALKYGNKAEVSLQLDQGVPCICIEDEGPGIPEAEREKVFEPFYRMEESRSRHTGGTGLGLAIARDLLLQEGGCLLLESRTTAQPGLRVKVLLPASGRV